MYKNNAKARVIMLKVSLIIQKINKSDLRAIYIIRIQDLRFAVSEIVITRKLGYGLVYLPDSLILIN